MTRGSPGRRSHDHLTCAVGASLAGGIDGFLADLAFRLKPAVLAARTVPVTEHRQWLRTWFGPACGLHSSWTFVTTLGSRRSEVHLTLEDVKVFPGFMGYGVLLNVSNKLCQTEYHSSETKPLTQVLKSRRTSNTPDRCELCRHLHSGPAPQFNPSEKLWLHFCPERHSV